MQLFYKKNFSLYADFGFCSPAALQADNTEQLRLYRAILSAGIRTQLPDSLREVTELYYLQGLSQAEIARRLGIDRSTVQRRLQRAMQILRRFAQGCLLCCTETAC